MVDRFMRHFHAQEINTFVRASGRLRGCSWFESVAPSLGHSAESEQFAFFKKPLRR